MNHLLPCFITLCFAAPPHVPAETTAATCPPVSSQQYSAFPPLVRVNDRNCPVYKRAEVEDPLSGNTVCVYEVHDCTNSARLPRFMIAACSQEECECESGTCTCATAVDILPSPAVITLDPNGPQEFVAQGLNLSLPQFAPCFVPDSPNVDLPDCGRNDTTVTYHGILRLDGRSMPTQHFAMLRLQYDYAPTESTMNHNIAIRLERLPDRELEEGELVVCNIGWPPSQDYKPFVFFGSPLGPPDASNPNGEALVRVGESWIQLIGAE